MPCAPAVLTRDRNVDGAPARLFANAEWRVLPDGLEHPRTGYFIGRETLPARRPDGLWEWPLHMAEKPWCATRPFQEAFAAALAAFGLDRDAALTRTFANAADHAAGPVEQAASGFTALGDHVRRKPATKPAPRVRPPAELRYAGRGVAQRDRVAVRA